MKHILLPCLLLLGLVSFGHTEEKAKLRFSKVLTDNVVLQRNQDLTCWGWAQPGSTVDVLLSQSRQEVVALVGEEALTGEANTSKRPKTPRKPETYPNVENVRISYVHDGATPLKSVRKQVKAGPDGKWMTTLGCSLVTAYPNNMPGLLETGIWLKSLRPYELEEPYQGNRNDCLQ